MPFADKYDGQLGNCLQVAPGPAIRLDAGSGSSGNGGLVVVSMYWICHPSPYPLSGLVPAPIGRPAVSAGVWGGERARQHQGKDVSITASPPVGMGVCYKDLVLTQSPTVPQGWTWSPAVSLILSCWHHLGPAPSTLNPLRLQSVAQDPRIPPW